jgi:hypothetical protein
MTLRVRGVVGPEGAAAVRLAPDPETWLYIEVRPWRTVGGSIQDRPLRLRMAVDADSGPHWIERAPPGAVIEFEVDALVREGEVDQAMIRLDGPVEDAELAARAADAPPPPEIDDPTFGALVYRPGLGWFEGEAVWRGRPVRIHLSDDSDQQAVRSLAVARRLWAGQDRWHGLIVAAMLRDLLPLKNETWLEPDEETVTGERFLASVALESISVYPDGGLEFFFDDGDLFFGHSIIASGDVESGIGEAHLAG